MTKTRTLKFQLVHSAGLLTLRKLTPVASFCVTHAAADVSRWVSYYCCLSCGYGILVCMCRIR